MARLGTLRSIWFFALMLALEPGRAQAQAPCTDEQAREKHGSLTLDRRDQSELDAQMRFKPDPVALKKIDQAIALLKQALPDFKGAEGHYLHEIYTPKPNSHVLHFSIRLALFAYYCAPANYAPEVAGKIALGGETGTWITIDFNSLGWLVEERSSLGKELRTPNGEIFELPKEGSELKGRRLYLPEKYGTITQVVLFAAPNHFPFKPVTREEFLQAREKLYRTYIDKVPPDASGVYRDGLDQITRLHASLSPAELQQQAIVRDPNQTPPRGKVFVTEAEHGLRLVTIDRNYIDPTLPRSAVQLITLHWWNNDQNPATKEVIRQFESNFDFDALGQLMDR